LRRPTGAYGSSLVQCAWVVQYDQAKR